MMLPSQVAWTQIVAVSMTRRRSRSRRLGGGVLALSYKTAAQAPDRVVCRALRCRQCSGQCAARAHANATTPAFVLVMTEVTVRLASLEHPTSESADTSRRECVGLVHRRPTPLRWPYCLRPGCSAQLACNSSNLSTTLLHGKGGGGVGQGVGANSAIHCAAFAGTATPSPPPPLPCSPRPPSPTGYDPPAPHSIRWRCL